MSERFNAKYKTLDEFLEIGLAPNIIAAARQSTNSQETTNLLREMIPGFPRHAKPRTLREWLGKLRQRGYNIPNLQRLFNTAEGGEIDDIPAKHVLKLHKLKRKITQLQAENRTLSNELIDAEKALEFKDALAQMAGPPVKFAAPKRKGGKSPLTVVALASDWHVGERVDPLTVNHQNEYNPEIAKRRAENYFQRVAFMTAMFQREFNVERLLLWIGGDMVTGAIHPDIAEMNELGPFGEAEMVLDMFEGGLNYWLETIPNIHVMDSDGNHGRITPKMRVATRMKYSLEAFMYRRLEDRLRGEDRVTWQHSTGLLNYIDIYGYLFRFLHGEVIRYNSGAGGISIPLNKKIAKWDEQTNPDTGLPLVAHCTIMGHFHELQYPRRAVVNGTLMGQNAFGQNIAGGFEPPQQGLFAVHPKIGRTMMSSIIVD